MEFEIPVAIIVAGTTGSPFGPKLFSQTIHHFGDRSSPLLHFSYNHSDFASPITIGSKRVPSQRTAKCPVLLFLTKRYFFLKYVFFSFMIAPYRNLEQVLRN